MTPVGALLVHFLSCLVLIFATFNVAADETYSLLSGLLSYLLQAWFGFFLAAGTLKLRIFGPPETKPVATANHPGQPNQRPVRSIWATMTGASEGSASPFLSVA